MTPSTPWQGRHGPLLIAEIGGNHEGDFDAALRLLDLAVASGADYVKFQLYTGDSLVSPVESPDRHRHFQRFELAPDQHIALARRCAEAGVGYMASVWNVAMLDWIDDYLPVYKIGSGDLTAYPLLRAFAERGKPIILSTGLSTLEDVAGAVDCLQAANPVYHRADRLALLQCTSSYPTPAADVHLRAMDSLRDHFGVAVGYSHHTPGVLALLLAAARGAEVLEFHFTDTREARSFRDHAISLTADEVRAFCEQLGVVATLLGAAEKRPQPSEIDSGHVASFRRGVYARRDIAAGEIIQAADLVCLRPNHGLDAREFDALVGRTVVAPIRALAAIHIDCLSHPGSPS